jgi:hypothetical protein
MDADKTELPKGKISWQKEFNQWISFFVDVAFKIGGSTSIQYLVLQVHYSNIDKFTGNEFQK